MCARLKIHHPNHQSFRQEVEMRTKQVDYWLDYKSFDSKNWMAYQFLMMTSLILREILAKDTLVYLICFLPMYSENFSQIPSFWDTLLYQLYSFLTNSQYYCRDSWQTPLKNCHHLSLLMNHTIFMLVSISEHQSWQAVSPLSHSSFGCICHLDWWDSTSHSNAQATWW